jgi:hypothetical protein
MRNANSRPQVENRERIGGTREKRATAAASDHRLDRGDPDHEHAGERVQPQHSGDGSTEATPIMSTPERGCKHSIARLASRIKGVAP